MNQAVSGMGVFAVPPTVPCSCKIPEVLPESISVQFLYAVPHSWRYEQCGKPSTEPYHSQVSLPFGFFDKHGKLERNEDYILGYH